MESGAGAPAA